jgi:hypothetical protein
MRSTPPRRLAGGWWVQVEPPCGGSTIPARLHAPGAERREPCVRAIRTGQLHALLRFDLRPIDVVVDHGSHDETWF